MSLREFSRGYLSFLTPEQLNDQTDSAAVQEFSNLTQPSKLEFHRIFRGYPTFLTPEQLNDQTDFAAVKESNNLTQP